MKIVLGVHFPTSCAAGLDVWVQGLLSGLSLIDSNNEYLIFDFFMRNFQDRGKTVEVAAGNNFHIFIKKMPKPLITFLEDHNIAVIEPLLKKHNIDIFHGTGYFLPYLKKIKGIVTIHGLDFIEMDAYWYSDKWYKNVPVYLKRADIIIAVSEYVKKAIIKHFGIPEHKIKVIYAGIRKQFRVIEDHVGDLMLKKISANVPYILTVATSVERKNIKNLLHAFAIAKQTFKDLKLVIVGDKKNIESKIHQETKDLKNDLIFSGYLDADQLAYFYNRAEVFVFPSLYEGFGLPVIEAMACGCPVITSNVSALPEIAGNAALLVNPYSIEEIASAIKKVLIDKTLKYDMKLKGLMRAKDFSWGKSAKEMVEIYETLCLK